MSKKAPRAERSAPDPAPFVLAPQRADGEPYTTSEIVAEGTGIDRRKVRDAIRKYQKDLETFGRVASYQAPLETNGGTQTITGYILNEQQATFLLTLLKNTPTVVAFKKELVRQFYAMRSLLLERASPIWQDTRSLGKEVRRRERELMAILREHGYDVRRGGSLSFGEVPDLYGLDGVHVECKRTESLRLWEWMAQAERDAQRFGDGLPAVFFRRSRSPWMVCMKLSDFMIFYQAAEVQHKLEDCHSF